eukprot:76360_1
MGEQNNTNGRNYLMKFVANTEPKMTLKAYFKHNDENLICLCGRGGHNTRHPGNRYIYETVDFLLDYYQSLKKEEKEQLTNWAVQDFESQGRRLFNLNKNGEWEELDLNAGKKRIRAKISQRFRDARICESSSN